MSDQATLPLENFIQAVQSQLDKAQSAMAMKARNLNLPLTFAIKDITLDLRAHVEFVRNEIRIRPAGATDTQASLFHLVFAAITRPMIEENATALADDPRERQIGDLKDDTLTEDNRRQLEWIGVRTVDKLKELNATGGVSAIGRVTGLPVERLRRALEHASSPVVDHVLPVTMRLNDGAEQPSLIRVQGHNFLGDGPAGKTAPRVTLGGQAMAVVKAGDRELLLAPQPHQWAGELSVAPAGTAPTSLSFDLTPFAPAVIAPSTPIASAGAESLPTNGAHASSGAAP